MEQDAQKARSRIETMGELRELKKNTTEPTKKSLIIKDISKVLTDIEESKRSRKILYFSEIQHTKVFDSKGKKVGFIRDLAIAGGARFPEVSHILVKASLQDWMIAWKDVALFTEKIILARPIDTIEKRKVNDDDVFLGGNILDKQVVDVNGLKVIRVNDISLTYIKGKLAVVSIDVGARSMMRRLGFDEIAGLFPSVFKDHPVPWDTIEPLTRSIEKIHLKVPCPRVSNLHPADVAELFDELSMRERKIILKSMKSETAAKVILECEPDVQKAVLLSLKLKRVASILEKMPANDAANVLGYFPSLQKDSVLKQMKKDKASQTQDMLSYKEGSVARYMTEKFVAVSSEWTVAQAINHIRKLENRPEHFHYIYVLDSNNTLAGVISLKNMIIANPKSKMIEIAVTKVVSVEVSDPIEYVEEVISKHDLLALPVVDVSGKIRGVVDLEDIVDVLLDRNKNNQPFELSDKQKENLIKEKRLKKYYGTLIKDVGQLLRDIENIGKKEKK